MTDAWLDAQYDNRAMVPDHAAVMQGWRAASAAWRADHPDAEIDVAYGDHPRHAMDVFWPAGDRGAPLALFIHGGYWQALDKSSFSHLAAGFLANGIALAIPSYRLCPDVELSVLMEDVRLAAAFLMQRYERDLYATGHSAGGHLTAVLLGTDWRARGCEWTVHGGCAISGLFDLRPLVKTRVNDALRLDEAEAWRLSPARQEPPAGARLQCFVGSLESAEFERQSSEMALAWKGSWSPVIGANHFTSISPLTEPRSEMMRAIAAAVAEARPGRRRDAIAPSS